MVEKENLGGGNGDNGIWGGESGGGLVKSNGFIKILRNKTFIDEIGIL